MKLTHSKKCIFLFIIGFLFIVLDLNVSTGKEYPHNYKNTGDVVGEFQYYNIKSTYGASCTYKILDDKKSSDNSSSSGAVVIDEVSYDDIRIDIFNDFIGFGLITLASFLMAKSKKSFGFSGICSIMCLILHAFVCVMPFVLNGVILCNFVMLFNIAYIFCGILATFFFTNGILALASDISCRDERIWIKMAWFVSSVIQVLTAFVFWLGSDFKALITIGNVFVAINLLIIVLYLLFVRRIFEYIQTNYDLAVSK